MGGSLHKQSCKSFLLNHLRHKKFFKRDGLFRIKGDCHIYFSKVSPILLVFSASLIHSKGSEPKRGLLSISVLLFRSLLKLLFALLPETPSNPYCHIFSLWGFGDSVVFVHNNFFPNLLESLSPKLTVCNLHFAIPYLGSN